MRKMKRLLEFADFASGIKVESVDDIPFNKLNRAISKGDFNFDTDDFTVLLSLGGSEKTISIPHGLFLEDVEEKDPSLSSYIASLTSLDDIFTELKEFGWDFQTAIQGYVNSKYSPETFDSLPEIEVSDEDIYDDVLDDPRSGGSLDKDNRDDFEDWTDEDQEKYDDLINPDEDDY